MCSVYNHNVNVRIRARELMRSNTLLQIDLEAEDEMVGIHDTGPYDTSSFCSNGSFVA